MQLNFQTYGDGAGFPLLIIHGLFGSLDNWQTISRRLGESFQVFALDLRNHGRSPHSDELDFALMAADVAEFLETHRLDRVHLLGHSLGGKVAMHFALEKPERVEKLVVADIAPRGYEPSHLTILKALKSLDLAAFQHRHELDAALAPEIPEPALRQFLLKNVTRDQAGGFVWKMNLPAIDRHYSRLIQPIQSDRQYPGPALFLRGGKSGYVQAGDESLIRKFFPNARVSTIEQAGHWLHAEAPDRFVGLTREFLGLP